MAAIWLFGTSLLKFAQTCCACHNLRPETTKSRALVSKPELNAGGETKVALTVISAREVVTKACQLIVGVYKTNSEMFTGSNV
jgi:hypothetical protein